MPLRFDARMPRERAAGLRAASSAARRGDLVVVPTDTAYAVGTDAFSSRGIEALRRAKGRGRDLPIPVLVSSARTLDGIAAGLTDDARTLVEGFWPGPLTLVVRHHPTLAWEVGDAGTVQVRMPIHPLALELLRQTGPLAMTGANLAGMALPLACDQAERQLGDSVTAYLDAGPLPEGPASTVVDVTADRPRLLRRGAYPAELLQEAVPRLVLPEEVPA